MLGQNAEVGDAEDEKHKKVHAEGYEVPRVTMSIKNVNSDEDFEQPPASRTGVRKTDGCVAQRMGKGKERAAPERDTRSRYIDGRHTWGVIIKSSYTHKFL